MSRRDLIGYIDYIDGYELCGWVIDRHNPDEAIEVTILYNERPCGKIFANSYRDDLRAAKLGNGYHAFAWKIPSGETYTSLNKLSASAGDWNIPFSEEALSQVGLAKDLEENFAPLLTYVSSAEDAFAAVDERTESNYEVVTLPIASPADVRSAIDSSGLVDKGYIITQLKDDKEKDSFRKDPVGYLLSNMGLTINPHHLFDTKWYADVYRDKVGPAEHPISHYVTKGIIDGLMPNPGFLPSWYLGFVPHSQLEEARRNPLLHYLSWGSKVGASPHPLFQPSWYFEKHADIKRAGREPLAHYLSIGHRENRQPHPLIDPVFYSKLMSGNSIVIDHYWRIGSKAGLPSHPLLETANRSIGSRKPAFSPSIPIEPLQAWVTVNSHSNKRAFALRRIVRQISEKPLLSIVVPVYNPPINIFRDVIRSALEQSYLKFEIIIVDDASTNKAVIDEIVALVETDDRVKAIYHEKNTHISQATNDAVDVAIGDYIVFLDHDDLLFPDALAYLAIYIEHHSRPGVLYSDDCRTDVLGSKILAARFKPAWSPEFLLSYSYASHLRAVRTDLYKKIGGSRIGYEGSQDHDMFLRLAETGEEIIHIPFILYGRRAIPGSTALSGDEKTYSYDAGQKAVKAAFARRGLDVDVVRPDWAIRQGLGIYKPVMPDEGPSVTIIIPTKNNALTLVSLIRSLSLTQYRNYDVLIIDNASDDPQTLDYLAKCPHRVERIESGTDGFNFARLNNLAVKQCKSDLLLFLNDDTEVLAPEWLSQMVGWSRLEGVGVVGARLLLGNRRVQHGGVSPEQTVGYTMFRGLPSAEHGYLSSAVATRNCAAVTAACMLTSRSLFVELGGFDEIDFAVAFNDVDYCLRVRARGLRIVYCAEAELFHHEGTTRPKVDKPIEVANFKRKYSGYKDLYLNENLARNSNSMAISPTVAKLPVGLQSPRVLFCSHNLNHEGAPNSLFEIVSGLQQSGAVQAHVAAPQPGPLADLYRARGINVTYHKAMGAAAKAKTPDEYIRASADLAISLAVENYDVVFANTAELHSIIHCAKSANVPSIWCIREGEPWTEYFSKLPEAAEAEALKAFSIPYRVVFVSKASFQNWAALDTRGTFALIRNGLDVERFTARCSLYERKDERRKLGFSNSDVVILAVGGVIPRKGQHDLLLALCLLPPEVQCKVQVVIVGLRHNAYSERLSRVIEGFPRWLKDRVTLVPETRSVGQYYMVADVFFCGSRVESYPRIILEAEAAGLPIITTPVSGIPEQVYEGINAEFYSPGDISSLASIIQELANNNEKRANMAKQSKIVLQSLDSYKTMLSQYLQIIEAATLSSV